MFVVWFFVIKLGQLAKQPPVLIFFFGVALSPSEVLLMILLQSTDSLLHALPGLKSQSFSFADEF